MLFGNREKQKQQVPGQITSLHRLPCGHSTTETFHRNEVDECFACIEAIPLSKDGLVVELIQTETKRQALLFIHKREVMTDPETGALVARAPLSGLVPWETRDCGRYSLPNWRTAYMGLRSLIELFYGRKIPRGDECVLFEHVQKYVGIGKIIYLQRMKEHIIKLAELGDEDHIRLTPYMADNLSKRGFYALRVTYEPNIVDGQAQSWYETLREEGQIHHDPEIEVLLAPR